VGIIEVAIAMLVFAVGVMGMMAMQVGAKRTSYEAAQRSIATSLSRDILERMRSNPAVLDDYVIDEVITLATPAKDCSTTDCTPAELAAYDLWDWTEIVRGANEKVTIDGTTTEGGGLVEPLACITNTDGSVTVAIVWKGVKELADPNEPCGQSVTTYTDGVGVAGNSYRRVQVMTTYISEG